MMKQSAISCAWIVLVLILASDASAQLSVRADDHFTRTLVVSRLDLDEKVNQPIVQPPAPSLQADASPRGMIAALLGGLRDGEYLAYHPENLQQPGDRSRTARRAAPADFPCRISRWRISNCLISDFQLARPGRANSAE
ncbi:MAG: hypothetical protein AAGN35_20435 [Bacteroidota bacterium]